MANTQNIGNCTITLSGDIFGNKKKRDLQSRFTATPGKMFGMRLLTLLFGIVPFCLPFAICKYKRWICKHTFIVGMPLAFEGKGGPLLGNMFKWGFFSVITLGIYAIFLLPVRIKQWEAANTVFGEVA